MLCRTRPNGRRTIRALFSLGVLAMLAACASKPQMSAQQEAQRYLAHASRDYAPPGPASDPWGPYIEKAAARFDVPERWVREVMRQESGGRLYRNGELVTSSAGAMGLMQVMPGTFDELRARYDLGDDPFHPLSNIMAGTAYIREMYDLYGSPGFLAAYNAGPGRLDDYLTRGRTLPLETRRYVASIGPRIDGEWPQKRSPAEDTMLAQLPLDIPAGPRYASRRYDPRYDDAPPAPRVSYAQAAPRRSTGTSGVAYAAYEAPRHVPPAYVPAAPAGRTQSALRLARAPEPPRYLPPVPMPDRVQVAAAPQAAAQSATRRSAGFSLISSANAEPVSAHRGSSGGGAWAIQVGALPNDRLAAAEASAAQGKARDVLGGARVQVTGVKQGSGTLYRARLGGLSRENAQHACDRLARSRTNCVIVSPGARS